MNRSAALLSACVFLFSALTPAHAKADERYLSMIVGSKHFGNDALNNFNPGLTFGRRWAGRRPGTEWFAEAGVFYNSYEEISPLALAGTSVPIAQIGKVELRGGIGVGIAYYKTLSENLEDEYGIPNIAGFIPIVTASLAARVGQSEIRLTAVPPDTDTDFILNLSLTHSF